MDAAAPGWSCSSDPASRLAPAVGLPNRGSTHPATPCRQRRAAARADGRDVPPLMDLAALHHAARTEDVGDGPAQPRSAVDDKQQRPVRRQSARHQVAEQAGGDGSRLGGAFAQAQHVFPALCVDPQRDHHAVVPEDLAVDADRPQVQLAQRPAEKRLEALCRQRHEPATRHCSTSPARSRRPVPGPACPRTGASTPRRRPRPACARPAGRWPPPIGSSPAGLRHPSSARGAAAARPAARRVGLSTLVAPRGPLDLMAPLRTTQDFPVRLHHRLQDLQPGRDAKAMERFPDTVDHAEHRQRHLDRDGSRAGGLAGRLPPVMLRHGWRLLF